MCRLLIVVTSLVAEHRLYSMWVSVVAVLGLSSCGSQTLKHRLNSCDAQAELLCRMWDLPGPGIKPMPPALAGGFFTTEPPGRHFYTFNSVQFSCSVMSDICNPMDCSMPGLPVHHQLPEFTQTNVHWVGDSIQTSHPLSSPCPPAFNLSQHQGLFKWVSSLHKVAKVLEFQSQRQWPLRTDLL